LANQVYKDSAFLEFLFPHINKPDSKFKPDNPEFKVKGKGPLSNPAVLALKEAIDELANQTMEDFKASDEWSKVKPADRAKFEIYVPYEFDYDENGNETGSIIFDFKQNAAIRLKDGGTKEVTIAIYDAAGNPTKVLVRGGTIGRVRYALRPLTMKSLKKCGCRLDFSMVQIKKLAEGGPEGFGAIEDGWVDDGISPVTEDEDSTTASSSSAPGNADY